MKSLFQLDAEEREEAERLINKRLRSVQRTAKRCLAQSPARDLVDTDELVAIGYHALVQAVSDWMHGESGWHSRSHYIGMRIRNAIRGYLAQVLVEQDRFVSLDSDREARELRTKIDLLETVFRSEGRRKVREVVSLLEKERAIAVGLRFGLVDGRYWSYNQIAEFTGHSRYCIEKLMKNSLTFLRHPIRKWKLQDLEDGTLDEYPKLPDWSPG